ncbi:MAG: phosphatase PAP2 family protein [Ignavibacteriales bacterium]|nr:MAG: phosphatase PAP2 family protein [Ignavibacteriales bacterium]
MKQKLRAIYILFFISTVFLVKLSAQEDPSLFFFQFEDPLHTFQQVQPILKTENTNTFNWHDPITKLPNDFYSLGKNAFSANSINTIAGLTILTGLLVSVDHETIEPFRTSYKTSPAIHQWSKNISWFGGGEFHLIMASAFGGFGLALNDNRAMRTGLQIVEAELATGITVQILKHISGRESPQSASHFHGLFRPFPNLKAYQQDETKYYSFPSGHVSTSVAVLTVIADNYPEVSWIKPVGYSAIGLIGVGLVARGWHWFSDFPLAVAIGYMFGKVISGRNNFLQNDGDNSSWSIYPDYYNGMGFGFAYHF